MFLWIFLPVAHTVEHSGVSNLAVLAPRLVGRGLRRNADREHAGADHEDEVDAEIEVVAFSLPAQGEDRPFSVKRFLPGELFSQYQSKRDHWETSERKQRLHTQSSLGHLGV